MSTCAFFGAEEAFSFIGLDLAKMILLFVVLGNINYLCNKNIPIMILQ